MNRKNEVPQNDEKTIATTSTHQRDKENEKTDILNLKVYRPKKEIAAIGKSICEPTQSGREKYGELEKSTPSPKNRSGEERKRKLDTKKGKISKKISRDESDDESDKSNEEKENKEEIKEMKKKLDVLMEDYEELVDQNRILQKRVDDLEEEVSELKNNEVEYLVEREMYTTEKRKIMENDLEISKDDIEDLKKKFQKQLEIVKPAEEAVETWKIVDEKIRSEVKYILNKLEKTLKKKDMNDIVENLKKEMSEMKKMIEVKRTPTSPMKHNNYWWDEHKTPHTRPMHSPEKDWWQRKKVWWKPMWCQNHGVGGHTTSQCGNKKKLVWRVKGSKNDDEKEINKTPTVVSPKVQ